LANKYWQLLYGNLGLPPQKYQDFLEIIDAAVIK
jgi:hypothetical protein